MATMQQITPVGEGPTFAQRLATRIWTTQGARYNAYRRLQRQHYLSLGAITLLSCYVIAGSIASLVPGLIQASAPWLGVLLTVSSVLTLALSLLEAGKAAQLRSDKHHSCGIELLALNNRLESLLEANAFTVEDNIKYSDDYTTILLRYSENHDQVDYDLFRAQHWKDFKISRIAAVHYRANWWVHTYAGYILLLIAPPLVALLVLLF